MKRFITVLLAIVMAFVLITIAACQEEVVTVRVNLYVTENDEPITRNHVIGQDDLPTVTNGDLVFGGWYYDKAYKNPYSHTDTDITSGTSLYAKWSGSNSQKVTVTLNMGYADSTSIVFEIDKNTTPQLQTPSRQGYTFGGWFTEMNGNGIQWTSSTAVSTDLTLYAKWTPASGGNEGGGEDPDTVDLSDLIAKYADSSTWNFSITVTYSYNGVNYADYYEYLGDYVANIYEGEDGVEYTEYLDYNSDGTIYYYYDNGDGTYTKYDNNSEEFDNYYSGSYLVDLTYIDSSAYSQAEGYYLAVNPGAVGDDVLGGYQSITYTDFKLYVTNGNITKIVTELSNGDTITYEFGKYGQVSFTLPEVDEGGSSSGDPLPTEPTGEMENQVYDAESFDNSNLQDKMLKYDEAIGLPSTGAFNALVIPVQFKGDTITQTQLNNLNVAFNGTSEQTGWESVASFYKKSSYGKLNITFDIQDVYQANNNATYYKNYKQSVTIDGQKWNKDGSALILEEALAYYESRLDLTKYDTNGDGCIDAVYLIYSESVDYDDADFYWAYVTWYYGDQQYDGKDAFYYLFAGFDFMDEQMSGVKVNAETYIHETGHLLGLDDYYDYDYNSGANQGLGGADMMDHNVGDHGVYSKIMLGWLDPAIVTSTTTVTLQSSQAGGHAILIPLNWNNSYFCEYLLIDLYTSDGLNAMGASQQNTILYDGAEYGVRIYHVSSSADNPYSDEYGSFTDKNNSLSGIPLIKLVEADGQTTSSAKGDWASESDLWQTGYKFSEVFPEYMRNDGKTLNFDISIDSVSAESATITITYNSAE